MLDRLQKIKHRLEGRGYDFTKDVEVTELFDDLEWLIKEIERLHNILKGVDLK